jgi:hypothetical protein
MALATVATPTLSSWGARQNPVRSFNVCLAPAIANQDAELVQTIADAGVQTVWLADFLYGHRLTSEDILRQARKRLEARGLRVNVLNCSLGHPGNSLGSVSQELDRPPKHWRTAQRPDGTPFWGTSIHSPANDENNAILRKQHDLGFRSCFLDDDFRLARSPGEIGGCFCNDHRDEFLRLGGYKANRWNELCDDVAQRRLTPLLRAWIDYQGSLLIGALRGQRQSFGGDLGVMVMYLGSEKAGIRLKDLKGIPARVGESMFSDATFQSPKNKTDELFSVLFHRRYIHPENAYSETTAYPSDQLSAENLAAKLVISTLADVRHTFFMSGLTPFPRAHWATLAPAMRQQVEFHKQIAGAVSAGPFKHFWGDAERYVGEDQPFSLWLAMGIPFEVVDTLPRDGWTFLSDYDAREISSSRSYPGTQIVCRDTASKTPADSIRVEESLPKLFEFKNKILPLIANIPHIVEEQPAICAWYPKVRKVMVWNLSTSRQTLTLAEGNKTTTLNLGPLESTLVESQSRNHVIVPRNRND